MGRIYRFLSSIVDIVLAIVEIFLAFRLVLRFFGANAASPFVSWIYGTSQSLIEPFTGMFPSPVLEGGFVLEFNTLFAMIIYALAAFIIQEIIRRLHRSAAADVREVHHYHEPK